MRAPRAAECKPGYSYLQCSLPPDACEHSGQKIFPEEKLMEAVVPRAPIAPKKKRKRPQQRAVC